MNKSIFLQKSVPDLILGLQNKDLTIDELFNQVESCMRFWEPKIHAWVCYDLAQVREKAGGAKGSGLQEKDCFWFHGIPFGIKDIFNTANFPTQMGSDIWSGFTPGNNARVVDSLLRHGASAIGKTVTAEFAVHELNKTLNPHDVKKTPGTSSSGSAAAVATGMIPFALATQTAGSIIRPASFCGVWGMKPSFGLIPRTGVLKTSDSLDTIGFIASWAKSLKPILDAVRVRGPNYPYVYHNIDRKRKQNGYAKTKQWKIGFVKTKTWDQAESYVKDSIEKFISKIQYENNFQIEEIEEMNGLDSAHDIHSIIYQKSLSYYFENESKISSKISPIMKRMIESGNSISPIEYFDALKEQEDLCRNIDQMLSKYDFVISIATSSSAPERGVIEAPDPSLIWTLGHLPSVTAPLFRCPENLPYGIQFISRRWCDYSLLDGIEQMVDCGLLPAGSSEILAK
jgi:Asp-tRNA(Asn)/Glu-tRNA(Gln) amidotransferase A subunit family amidase